jgi:hypothetical protein
MSETQTVGLVRISFQHELVQEMNSEESICGFATVKVGVVHEICCIQYLVTSMYGAVKA